MGSVGAGPVPGKANRNQAGPMGVGTGAARRYDGPRTSLPPAATFCGKESEMTRTQRLAPVLAFALALALAAPVRAERPPLGLRAGYTSWESIHQFHFGGHAKLGDLFPNVALVPGLEVGMGDDVTVVTANGDLVYRVTELSQAPWGPYAGGSLSFNFIDSDAGSDSDLGLSAVGGTTYALDNGNEVFVELRLGIMDSPGLKITAGYTFF